MSTGNGNRAISGQVEKPQDKGPDDYIIRLAMEKRTQNRIAAVLPPHVKLDRFNAVFSQAIRGVKDLDKCEPMTVIGGIIMASQLGLELNTPQQQAFLLPFRKGRDQFIAQLIIGYRGMVELVGRTGLNASFYASEVYTNDVFHERRGSVQELVHEIVDYENRGDFKGAYAVAKIPGRADSWTFLPKAEIEKAKAVNKGSASEYSPWSNWYDEMAKKTAFRRLFKWLPSSVEQRWGEPTLVAKAMAIDDAAAAGSQRLAIESGLVKEGDPVDPVERMRTIGAETANDPTPGSDGDFSAEEEARIQEDIARQSGELFPNAERPSYR